MRKVLALACLFGLAAMVFAAPPGLSSAPLGSAERAFKALDWVSSGTWIEGNWALRLVAHSGKKKERIVVPISAIGGYDESAGRWQRLFMPGGQQYLIKGRGVPTIWDLNTPSASPMSVERLHQPIFERLGLTWEVFSMNFLNYPQRKYLEVGSVMGRYCDKVELTDLDGQRAIVWLDIEFGAPLQAQIFDKNATLRRTMRVVSLQKADSQWILRRYETVDAVTKVKITIEVAAVALGNAWSGEYFDESKTKLAWPEISNWMILE